MMGIMDKRTTYTKTTPLPAHIHRQLVIDMLHAHTEVIELNPAVIEHHSVQPPDDAPPDERSADWHEFTEKIQYLPGLGEMASGKVTSKVVFHDMPSGLKAHVYAPLGLDIRNNWQVQGNQPEETQEASQVDKTAPHDGLHLCEDVDMTCNWILTGFVQGTLERNHADLVDRLIKKAELRLQE